ncbi:hypothetical protein ACFE04_024801 [Oxalis oulophora]
MKLEVEVISSEIIKPSSSTPDHLRRYQLSFIDQTMPPVYNSIVMFYPHETDTKLTHFDKVNLLKNSLSQVLPHFYPLAGSITDNQFVDCNDKGVVFIEAQVNCLLSEFLEDIVPGELNKLLSIEIHGDADFLTGIQVNLFQCGGIGLGVSTSHRIGDALSLFVFIKSWAAVCRGEKEFIVPEFKSSSVFPPKQIDKRGEMTEPDIVTKRFVFNANMITDIREKYAGDHLPSRVQALSAFIWSRLVSCDSQLDLESKKSYMIGQLVNLRSRFDPPLTQISFGNYFWHTAAFPGSENEIVSCLKESLNKINKDFIMKLQEGIIDIPGQTRRADSTGFFFTSLCRFPIYDADFGWNHPVRVCPPARKFRNIVILMDTKFDDGIEAYISLKDDCMALLESDQEFLKYLPGC